MEDQREEVSQLRRMRGIRDRTGGVLFTGMASYLRKMMTKLCLKVHMKSDSVIELAFP